jgi:hypothetical protein
MPGYARKMPLAAVGSRVIAKDFARNWESFAIMKTMGPLNRCSTRAQ